MARLPLWPLSNNKVQTRVQTPSILRSSFQDDLISQVSNEINVTADFIRNLPQGSRVMVGYITTGTLQVRQPFTSRSEQRGRSLRIRLRALRLAYNPYVEVLEALRQFDSNVTGRNAILLVSDGLDTSRGFDSTSAGYTLDLERAIRAANSRNVAIFLSTRPQSD